MWLAGGETPTQTPTPSRGSRGAPLTLRRDDTLGNWWRCLSSKPGPNSPFRTTSSGSRQGRSEVTEFHTSVDGTAWACRLNLLSYGDLVPVSHPADKHGCDINMKRCMFTVAFHCGFGERWGERFFFFPFCCIESFDRRHQVKREHLRDEDECVSDRFIWKKLLVLPLYPYCI